MRILLWHVHGSWTTAFVQGSHTYLLPTDPERSADGLGRARTWEWPSSTVEVTAEEAADSDVDVVVVQRPRELTELAPRWLGGRRPGVDVPAVYLEHNAPEGPVNAMRHPAADRPDLIVCHVTWFNELFWDCGTTETTVIEHGVVDPGPIYTGDLQRAAAVINEPARRGRVVGADLLPRLADLSGVDVDLFGMKTGADLPQAAMHQELARRRVYVHPFRWTSLGLALIEAMHIGMPVVALATTEVPAAVPRDAGVVSNNVGELADAMRRLAKDPDEARQRGAVARRHALEHYGLGRFLADWDLLLERVAA